MELENDNKDFTINKKDSYTSKLEDLKGGIGVLLDEFAKLYILTKLHPTNSDIQEKYQSTISNINQLQSKIFSISNGIQVDTADLNKQLLDLNILIKDEKQKNKELKKRLGIVESNSNSSEEMINNYKDLYNEYYLRNWALLLSASFCLYAIYSVYKTPKI